VDFDLSPDQLALRDAARELLDDLASPEKLRAALDSETGYDAALWRAMAEQGWLALDVAEADGGLGLGFVELVVLAEEIGRHVAPAPFIGTVLARWALADDPAWGERLASGDAVGAVAWGSAVVPDLPIADVLVVVEDEVSAYDLSGERPERLRALDLTRTVARADSSSFGAPAARGDAARAAALLDRGAALYAAELLGTAGRMLEASVDYAKVREQFGRPIGSFQAIKHRCADMLVDVEGIRSAVWYAAWAIDADGDDRSLAASTAKSWASDAGMRVLNSALQVHGGIGFTWEHDLHLYLKRAQLDSLLFGDAPFHRDRIATLLKERVDAGVGVF
jgi:alkylation response protein AidB-like acyl-CoA dehydrogenase